MPNIFSSKHKSQEQSWKYFEQNPISHSAAHYLMTIDALKKELGYARVTDVARKLEVTPGSCSVSLSALKKRKLVHEDEHKFLSLSAEGEKIVNSISLNDELLSAFLRDILHVSPDQADIDSCKMEHLLSAESSEKLAHFIAFIKSNSPIIQAFLTSFHNSRPSCSSNTKSCAICEKRCFYNAEA